MGEEVEIRRAVSTADYLACQDAQRRAWGIVEDGYVVPLATLVGANLHGGLVLGAFTDSGEALGVSFAFLGKVEGRACLYSQLTGVVPGQQGKGLGGRLKDAQREFARSEGLGTLAWAFDPLQAGNARFNFGRLGVTSGRFVEDMYGRRTDALNAGAATDRLIVEWATDPAGRPPIVPDDVSGLPRLIDVRESEDGANLPLGDFEVATAGPTAVLEIPANVTAIRRDEPELAESWGLAVRRAFREAFAAGYRAEGFVRDESSGRPRCYYVLVRHPTARPG